jgi:hypothetical protein
LQLLRVELADLHAHGFQQLNHRVDVLDLGDVLDPALLFGKETGREDRENSVFRTADRDLADQPAAPLDQELRH